MPSPLFIASLIFLAGGAASACGGDESGATTGDGGALLADGGGLGGSSSGTGGSSSGGDAGNAGSPPTGPSSERAACRAYLTAACERIAECNQDPGGLEPCLALRDQCPDYLFSEGSARTIDSAFACAAQWDDLPCERVGAGASPSCATPGTLAPGEPCLFVSQCASLRCTGGGGSSCGVCLSLAELGGACDNVTIGCALGQDCSAGTCQPTMWTPPLPPADVPDAEAPSQPGESCWNYIGCVEGFECLRDEVDDSIQTCRVLPGSGEECAENSGFTSVCAPEAYCPAPPEHTCIAKPLAGEPCYFNGYVWDCADGHICETGSDGTRTCVGFGDEGASCGSPTAQCAPGTECQSGTCTATDEKTLFEAACGP